MVSHIDTKEVATIPGSPMDELDDRSADVLIWGSITGNESCVEIGIENSNIIVISKNFIASLDMMVTILSILNNNIMYKL